MTTRLLRTNCIPAPRVAVIDNDQELLTLSVDIFADEGWQTMPFRNGEVAIDLMRQDPPDVIVLDLWLDHPESGWFILKRLLIEPALRETPVIIWTGSTDHLAEKQEWLEQRGLRVITKPFEIDELCRTVREAISTAPRVAEYALHAAAQR
jgi:DNA-binding response OmpR family regulator